MKSEEGEMLNLTVIFTVIKEWMQQTEKNADICFFFFSEVRQAAIWLKTNWIWALVYWIFNSFWLYCTFPAFCVFGVLDGLNHSSNLSVSKSLVFKEWKNHFSVIFTQINSYALVCLENGRMLSQCKTAELAKRWKPKTISSSFFVSTHLDQHITTSAQESYNTKDIANI